jgi:hypothetical protein
VVGADEGAYDGPAVAVAANVTFSFNAAVVCWCFVRKALKYNRTGEENISGLLSAAVAATHATIIMNFIIAS